MQGLQLKASTFVRFLQFSPMFRPLRVARKRIIYVSINVKRLFMGQSNTWWDNQSYGYIKDEFLRDEIDGVSHPSREYIREWLTANPGLSILDIPCGPGVEYEGIRNKNIPVRYIGMDKSDTVLRAVVDRFPEINVRKGDITQIPLPDRSVDIVLCRHILEHLEDYRPAVQEALRVARQYVFIILFKLPTRKEVMHIGWGTWDNRLQWDEFETFLSTLRVTYDVERIPYKHPVREPLEENTIIKLRILPE
jgi:SAM-dependent methyltransferase